MLRVLTLPAGKAYNDNKSFEIMLHWIIYMAFFLKNNTYLKIYRETHTNTAPHIGEVHTNIERFTEIT